MLYYVFHGNMYIFSDTENRGFNNDCGYLLMLVSFRLMKAKGSPTTKCAI